MYGSILIHGLVADAVTVRAKLCLFSSSDGCHFFSITKPCISLIVLCNNIPIGIDAKLCPFQNPILIEKSMFFRIPTG